ncbi:sulfate adenylyltransferase subunit 1 [Quadrisphaera granulorum]|uniref:sulfate adenylyltransferase n=1 Tax=Quadrisphaera granulorum TaxID=317664 RepID=A0A316AFH5_9ACTN|nr:GTP-binding protein [Quadrisphaera granulorum]PWJ56109.1 sulfate adenylyltransferase subunit 1 [Quadrisphaera granulorum]SZE94743.1 sulfate adenylyltransferase subunit 1 [Quadrisphaera granulorum]
MSASAAQLPRETSTLDVEELLPQEAPLLRLATAGSVDDGKSTLVGRLLHDTKSVLADQLDAITRTSRDRGLERVDLSLLTDGLRAEREQGITIDVAYRYFSTPRRRFVLADTPGHVQYTRNMVTGASTAQVAVLLLDARHGVVEQTRRHAAVSALLGVPHLVLAVNKMDLVDFDEARFRQLHAEAAQLVEQLGLRADQLTAVPVCALDGDNVADRSDRMPWYDGPSLLELLEQLPVADDVAGGAARMPVQYVLRDHDTDYRAYAGLVTSGSLAVGEEVVVLPRGQRTRVAGIDTADGPLQEVGAGRSVALRLTDDVDVSRGDLIAAVTGAPEPVQEFSGTVCWLHERPLRTGDRLLLRHGTRTVRAIVREVTDRLDVASLEHTGADGQLALNEIGGVVVRTAEPLPLDAYRELRPTGAFLLIDPSDGATLGAGMAGAPIPGLRAG